MRREERLSKKSPRKTGFFTSVPAPPYQPSNPADKCPLNGSRICRISAKFFESTTEYIAPNIFVLFTTHDRRFLQENSEKDPEDRVCTKVICPHRPVLLYFYAVLARINGADGGPVPGIVFLYHRFREIFFGRPGRYDLTRLFSYTSMTAGPAG